jgi:hypothetical protein
MLQHRIFFNGHYLLKNKSHDRISLILRHLVSYEQHASRTVPQQSHSNSILPLTEKIPSSCHILIAGGGIIGQSVAYHLSEIGVKDVVLVEKSK